VELKQEDFYQDLTIALIRVCWRYGVLPIIFIWSIN
jgi:hypothetical protein